PFRDWPALESCFGCESWKGYSLDPEGGESFVSCARGKGVETSCPKLAPERSRAAGTKVAEVMSDPVCVRAHVPIDEVARVFIERRISGAPVVDADGRPLGVI